MQDAGAAADPHGIGREQIGDDLDADAGRQSRAAAPRPERPSRSRAAASARRRRPARRLSTTGRPPAPGRLQPRARELQSYSARCDRELRGAQRLLPALRNAVCAASSSSLEMAPAFTSACWRRSVDWRARQRCRRPLALGLRLADGGPAASTAAASSACVRASRSGAAAGMSRATTVLPRATGSPGSSSMRSDASGHRRGHHEALAHAGLPSSSIVTCSGAARRLRHLDLDRARPQRRQPGWPPTTQRCTEQSRLCRQSAHMVVTHSRSSAPPPDRAGRAAVAHEPGNQPPPR